MKLETNVTADLATRLAEQLTAVAPEVLEITLAVIRWTGASHLIGGVVALVISYVLIRLAVPLYRKSVGTKDPWEATDQEVGAVFLGLGGALSGVGAMVLLLNVWNWVAVFSPQLALARQVITKVLN